MGKVGRRRSGLGGGGGGWEESRKESWLREGMGQGMRESGSVELSSTRSWTPSGDSQCNMEVLDSAAPIGAASLIWGNRMKILFFQVATHGSFNVQDTAELISVLWDSSHYRQLSTPNWSVTMERLIQHCYIPSCWLSPPHQIQNMRNKPQWPRCQVNKTWYSLLPDNKPHWI